MGQRGRPRHPELLTLREQEVLALVREGLTNEQIAERLGVSFETAKAHVGSILSKLGVESREEAAAWRQRREPLSWLLVGAAAAALASAALAFVLILGFGWLKAGDGDAVAALSASPSPTTIPSALVAPASPTPTLDWASAHKTVVDTENIFIANKLGGDERFLAQGFDPAWSPSGESIAYVGHWTGSNIGGRNWIDLITLHGEHVREVGFYDWDDVGGPCLEEEGPVSWQDNTTLLIRPDASPGSIVNISTGATSEWSGCVLLSATGTTLSEAGSYSPDGKRFVTSNGEVVDVQSGDRTSPFAGDVYAAKWSPDGSRIAYYAQTFESQCFGIHIAEASGFIELGFIANGDFVFDWSPDGSSIVFSRDPLSPSPIACTN